MKKRLSLAVAVFILLTIQLQAQSPLLDQPVSLSCRQLPLSSACEQLQREYQLSFAYFNQSAALQKPINLELKAQPLKLVLEQLLSGTNLQYQVIGNQITLREFRPTIYTELKGKVMDKLTQLPLVS